MNFRKWWQQSGIITASVLHRFDDSSPVGAGMQAVQDQRPANTGLNSEQRSRAAYFAAYPEAAYQHPREAAELQDLLIRKRHWEYCMLPHANTYIGPGSLCIYAGSQPESSNGSVWFHERPDWDGNPADISFDAENLWWRRTLEYVDRLRARSCGQYYIALPDLVENWDIVASLRNPTTLLMDMLDRPQLVEEQIAAANRLYSEVYWRLYHRIKDAAGACMYEAFYLWAPGPTAKLQCDGSAMFGPDMFRRFVLPGLASQAAEIDYTMYHLDGTQCIAHLDAVLEIPDLKAVEWTPQAGQPGGTDPCWYDMYKRILQAGKSLQVLVEDAAEVPQLLNAIGTEGVYLLGIDPQADAAALQAAVAKFARGRD